MRMNRLREPSKSSKVKQVLLYRINILKEHLLGNIMMIITIRLWNIGRLQNWLVFINQTKGASNIKDSQCFLTKMPFRKMNIFNNKTKIIILTFKIKTPLKETLLSVITKIFTHTELMAIKK